MSERTLLKLQLQYFNIFTIKVLLYETYSTFIPFGFNFKSRQMYAIQEDEEEFFDSRHAKLVPERESARASV